MAKRLLVTGGAGFMGSAFIRYVLSKCQQVEKVINLDLLTYAGNLKNVSAAEMDPRYHFVRGNILNGPLIEELCRTHALDAIVHFAAESHVDRSIENPKVFYETNVDGTLTLLEVARRFPEIRFHHISTDEVYGSIESGHFTEESPYRPNSPYSASKAASDHFVRSYNKTYGLFTTISHSTNNYGPCQADEKFIPSLIQSCLQNVPLRIYGKGINVRDWLYMDDHADAVWKILELGEFGQTYNISGGAECQNIDLAYRILEKFTHLAKKKNKPFSAAIEFVKDRPGHDLRYGVNSQKIQTQLGWRPEVHLDEGLEKTIQWYLNILNDERSDQFT